MKILLSSYAFFPNVGGLESVSELLSREFVRLGHEVCVSTQSLGAPFPNASLQVIRRPSPGALLKWVKWCDVVFHNNISLRSVWPLMLFRRPWIIAHQTWIRRVAGGQGWQDLLKRIFLPMAVNVSISTAIAEKLQVPSRLIPNPYDDSLFRETGGSREEDLIFVGRLVSDKGVDLLLDALSRLRGRGVEPRLTIVGAGSERGKLEQIVASSGLKDRVRFHGQARGEELVNLLNSHRVMVVPSRWEEPFGVVALEGIACGCLVVGSAAGGLRDAIGPCGVTFPNNDAERLAQEIERSLYDEDLRTRVAMERPAHLARHTAGRIAAEYLDLFQETLR